MTYFSSKKPNDSALKRQCEQSNGILWHYLRRRAATIIIFHEKKEFVLNENFGIFMGEISNSCGLQVIVSILRILIDGQSGAEHF